MGAAPVVVPVVVAAVVVLDQVSKAWARTLPAPHGPAAPRTVPVVRFRHVDACRRAWSTRGTALRCGVLVVGAVAAIVLGVHSTTAALAVASGVGGATGNVVDHLRRGRVTDFVMVGRWPAFNLADVALVAAVPLACLAVAP